MKAVNKVNRIHNITRFVLIRYFSMVMILTVPASLISQSQQFGVRLGDLSGLSYRYVNPKNNGIEINLQKWLPYWQGTVVSVLGEKTWDLKKSFSVYAGGGLFISTFGMHHYSIYENGYYYRYGNSSPNWGIEGVGGIQYQFKKAPLIMGVDVRPRFWGIYNPYFWDGGLNVRYTF
jgi:hypothetical protein